MQMLQRYNSLLYLKSLEDFAPPFVTGCSDQSLEDVAACRIRSQCQEVGMAQSAQAAEEQRSLLKLGQSLDQTRTVVTNGRQWNLEGKKSRSKFAATSLKWKE